MLSVYDKNTLLLISGQINRLVYVSLSSAIETEISNIILVHTLWTEFTPGESVAIELAFFNMTLLL